MNCLENKFTKIAFERAFEVRSVITLFYMELSKEFKYDGEKHDFWEMVYIDQGEMLCTADVNRFTLKSGELVFHKPNEYHNLAGDGEHSPNVSIITFECDSPAMDRFSGKIFKLTSDERTFLARIFEEGLSCYKMEDEYNPLIQRIEKRENAPFGSSQMTKNLLEMFLILLSRNKETAMRSERNNYLIDGITVSHEVKEILDFMQDHLFDSLSIKDIAKHLHHSESYVKKIFAKYYPGGIIRYYNSLKIREACRLIRDDTLSMAQISDMLGFENPQYFSHCFKQFRKISPSQYKKSIIKEKDV